MNNSMDDVLKDSCAVFGCATTPQCSKYSRVIDVLHLGLTALQHRGQESSGVVISDGTKFHVKKGMGLVENVYADVNKELDGFIGIGHNRYSTAGTSNIMSCQPFVVHTTYGKIAVSHNGELVNAKQIRKDLLQQGVGLSTESDSELITQLLVSKLPSSKPDDADWVSRISHLIEVASCSFSVLLLTSQNEIYAFRDPYGNRPLCLGEINMPHNVGGQTDSIFVVSSESCAFSSIGADFIREVKPGEIVKISSEGIKSVKIVKRFDAKSSSAFCIFEYVYFARADTIFEGQLVHSVRKQCGRQLAIEGYVDADLVSTIPESANPAAQGFADQSGIPFQDSFVKSRYAGRTFIQPSTLLRERGVSTKFGPLSQNIEGKRIVLIDDSIVRGNTMPRVVKLLKAAGAKEVHVRVASPPLKHPCFMGINIPTKEELIANKYTTTELAKYFGADSLVYLSIEGLKLAVTRGMSDKNESHCMACLTGKYPVELQW